jgi:hypothetical protein
VPRIWSKGPPSTGGTGGEYSAGEGLELKEIVGKVFAILPAVLAEIAAAVTEAGSGLEKSGKKLLVKAEGITNAMIVAAAGIPESKLSLPEMVTLGGTQTITGAKTFEGPQVFKGNLEAANLFANKALGAGKVTGKFVFKGPILLPQWVAALTGAQTNLKPPEEAEGFGAWIELALTEALEINSLEYPNELGMIVVMTNVSAFNATLRTAHHLSGNVKSGSKVIKGISSTAGLVEGEVMNVEGATAGIPAGTTIAKILSATEIEMSKAATKTTEPNELCFSWGLANVKNRFLFSTGKDIVLGPGETIWLGQSKTLTGGPKGTQTAWTDLARSSLKTATTPTPGAEEQVILGTAGAARKIVAAITGKLGVVKYKIKHGLETQALSVDFQTATAKLPGKINTSLVSSWEPISASEIEITTTLAAAEELFVTIIG